jgi:SnoaL-like domain
MSTSIDTLMRANVLAVFNERDPEARRAAIARIYAPDATFSDAEGVLRGHEALDEKVQRLLDDAPGFVFRLAGPVREVDDLGKLDWQFGPEGGPPVVTGTDVVLVGDDKITAAYTFVDGPG